MISFLKRILEKSSDVILEFVPKLKYSSDNNSSFDEAQVP